MADIFLYGEISSFENNATEVKDQLKGIPQNEEINIRINSPGGNVFEGFAIYTLISRLPNPTVAYVDGLAASIASLIALSADETLISDVGMFMIHNAMTAAGGNKDQLEKQAQILAQIDETLVSVYTKKTGRRRREIRNMMDAETFFNAKESIEMGFASSTYDSLPIAAIFNNTNNMKFSDVKNFFGIISKDEAVSLENLSDETQNLIKDELKNVVEEADKEAAEAFDTAEGVDKINAGFVKHGEFLAAIKSRDLVIENLIKIIEEHPNKEDNDEQIKTTIQAEFENLYKKIVSRQETPSGSNAYNVFKPVEENKKTLTVAQVEDIIAKKQNR